MKTVTILAKSRAGLTEVPPPAAQGSTVVVRVTAAPMCTEYHSFIEGSSTLPLGHEAIGTVVDAGSSSMVSTGDRVVAMPLNGCGRCPTCLSGHYIVCERAGNLVPSDQPEPGTMAEYIAKPDWLLVPVPADIPDVHAAMACCGLGASFGAVQRLALRPTDTVLVTGLGPVGLGAVINARFRGSRVIAVDHNEYRAELAIRLGADVVIDPAEDDPRLRVRMETAGAGVDAAIECSGAVGAQRLCIEAVRRAGQVAFVANSRQTLPLVVSEDLLHRSVTLFGSWHYNLSDAQSLMEQIQRTPKQLDRLVTHIFDMAQAQEAFELQVSGQCGKVVLIPEQGRDRDA